ncbi:hypothetical protein KM176_16390 [Pseudooceanicola sp. CBS1P-1]|uniref:Bro-N domain-containing protein n=1 Tax=Pseudooceanicola albus TaxID=2692189 RepID=A0A6L7G443_9RHOB|nr:MULTISPECIES: hypothetical protein [Pseudooceanicola]MBT9385454.1 hypothetical protein [Pseudooceanicola endophyticus]MXN19134.1 hypothetical protein [Pseudooceanicola albus]
MSEGTGNRQRQEAGLTSELKLFEFNGSSIRVVTLEGDPWFVAKDVWNALGMNLSAGTTQWLNRLAAMNVSV